MKKQFLAIPLIGIFFAGCSFTVPQKVTLKADADYNLSLLKLTSEDLKEKLNFSEMFSEDSISEMLGSGGEDSKIAFYQYNPGGNAQFKEFILATDIFEMPLDVSEYFSSLDVTDQISKMKIDRSIPIPELSAKEALTLNKDHVASIVNGMLGFYVDGTDSKASFYVDDIENTDFKTVTYESGKMYFEGYGASQIIVSSNGWTEYLDTDGFPVELDLAGKTISKDDFTVQVPFGSYRARVSDTAVPSKVTGLTLPNNKNTISSDVNLVLSADGVKSCKIGEGKIDLNLPVPASWSGVTLKKNNINLEGALPISDSEFVGSGDKYSASLNGKNIGSGTITGNIEFYFDAQDATIDFGEMAGMEIELDVKSLASVKVEIQGLETDINSFSPIPESMKQSVKSIEIEPSGLGVTYVNTMPAGNDIKITASSSFFKMDETVKVLSSGGTTDEAKKIELLGKNGTIVMSELNDIDFKAALTLPGATTDEPNIVEVVNVEPGKTYQLMLDVTPAINWVKITLDNSLMQGFDVEETFDTGLDPSTLTSGIGEIFGSAEDNPFNSVSLKELDLYLYLSKPDIAMLDQMSFNGLVELSMMDSEGKKVEGSKSLVMVGTEDGNAANLPYATKPDFAKLATKNVVTEPIGKDINDNEKHYSAFANLMDISRANKDVKGTVGANCKLSIGCENDIEIKKEDLSGKTQSSITVSAVIVLPLKLEAEKDIAIDLTSIVSGPQVDENGNIVKDEDGNPVKADFLNRSEKMTESESNEFFNMISEVRANMKCSKLPLSYEVIDGIETPSFCLKYDFNPEDDETAVEAPLTDATIKFTRNDLEYVMNTIPYTPELGFVIKKGTFGISRETEFDLLLNAGLKLKGEVSFDLGKKVGGNK